MLGLVIQILISGFIIGALARWAVPGPDPMTVPLTIMLGILGSFIGGGIAGAIFGADQDSGSVFAILIGSIAASTILLVAYRRWVQHRPISGPDAHRPPPRRAGTGGIFASTPGGRTRAYDRGDVAEQLKRLDELHDQGVLTDEEFEAKRAELLARP